MIVWWSIILGFIIMVPVAVYAAPGDLCFEDIDDMCGLLSKDPEQLFGSFMVPLESQAEGFSVVILWGGLLAIVWFKTEDIKILGVVGIVISATITGLSTQAQGIGMLLLGVSVGILLFQLIRQRVSIFS